MAPPDEGMTTTTETLPEEDDDEPIYLRGGIAGVGLTLALKVGAGFGLAELGTSFVPEVELGFLLPFADRMLELFLSLDWSNPGAEGDTEPDARLPGDGVAHWESAHQALGLGVGLRLRIPLESDLFRPSIAAGVRFHFFETEVMGDADGQPFGTNTEQGNATGFFAGLGAELFVGPGALLFEIEYDYAPLDTYVWQDTASSSLDLLLGYRFFF